MSSHFSSKVIFLLIKVERLALSGGGGSREDTLRLKEQERYMTCNLVPWGQGEVLSLLLVVNSSAAGAAKNKCNLYDELAQLFFDTEL